MQLFVFATLVETLVLVAAYHYLASRHGSEPLRWWTRAWSAALVRHLATLLTLTIGPLLVLRTLEQAAALVSGALLLRGTLALNDRSFPRWVWFAFLVPLAWIPIALGLDLSFIALSSPTFVLLGFSTMFTGWTLHRVERPGFGKRLTVIALVLWGLHQLDYPFVRPHPDLARWGYMLASLLESLSALGMLIVAFERVLAQLAESEARHRRLFERLPEGVFQTDSEGVIVDANPTLLEMLACDSVEELRALGLPGTFDESEEVHQQETRWRRRDGELIDVVLSVRWFHDERGRRLGLEGVVRDATEPRRLSARRSRAQRMEALGRLAGGVAHDFNNLLTAIRGGAAALARDRRLGGPAREWVDVIESAADRAGSLTHQLLAVSRGEGADDPQEVDLARLTREAASTLRGLLGEQVTLEVEATEPTIARLDPTGFEQVLLNLTVNARDAMPSGGLIRISVEPTVLGMAEARRLSVEPGAYAMLRVRDAGVGMDDDTRERLFEPFFTTKRGGTGLGLATVYATVVRGGGRIDVESRIGEGALFTVVWPLVEESIETSCELEREAS